MALVDPTGLDGCQDETNCIQDVGDNDDEEDGGGGAPDCSSDNTVCVTATPDAPDCSGDYAVCVSSGPSSPIEPQTPQIIASNSVPLSPKGQGCLNKIQSRIGPSSQYQGPTAGTSTSDPGFRNGAYNFNFFAPGFSPGPMGPNAIPGATCGRFPTSSPFGTGGSLHIVVPGGGCNPAGDPNIYLVNASGFTFTAHIDSSYAGNPFGAIYHFIVDVLFKQDHGC